MKMTAKFGAEGESFNACFEQRNSAFNAEFSASGGGQDGKDGATFIPSVSEDGVISWTNDKNLDNPKPVNIKGKDGKDGIDGNDGYTPIKGKDYFDGIDGKNGYTPVKGKDYFDGKDGKDGKDGADGQDGFSPVVSVEDIENGHRVTITDKDGNKTFDVMNGQDGQGGGGTFVQADWNVNDENDPAYVKNRTHWEEAITEKTTFTSEEALSAEPVNVGALVGFDYLPAYKFSDVVLDFVQCGELTISDFAFSYTNSSEDAYHSHMLALRFEKMPEVGAILCGFSEVDYRTRMEAYIVSVFDGSLFPTGLYFVPLYLFTHQHISNVTFTIEIPQKKYHKMQEEFIPGLFVVRVKGEGAKIIADKSYSEIVAHLANGDAVIVIYDGSVYSYSYTDTGNYLCFTGYSRQYFADDDENRTLSEVIIGADNRVAHIHATEMAFAQRQLRLSGYFFEADEDGVWMGQSPNGSDRVNIPTRDIVQSMIDEAIAKALG